MGGAGPVLPRARQCALTQRAARVYDVVILLAQEPVALRVALCGLSGLSSRVKRAYISTLTLNYQRRKLALSLGTESALDYGYGKRIKYRLSRNG